MSPSDSDKTTLTYTSIVDGKIVDREVIVHKHTEIQSIGQTAPGRSIQTRKWAEFSDAVIDHIENYVIPQYGDEGEDLAKDYTFDDCIKQVQRYLNRAGKSSRPGEEKRDMCKAAHWIQKAYNRLDNRKN